MRKDKKLPEMFEYLGWCSWDSCRNDVTEEKILAKAKDFCDNEIPVRWFLVDDGWYQEKGERLLWNTEPDENKFPMGIKSLCDRLKNEYDMKYVGFWECFSGCWRGINPESPIVKNHPELVYKTNDGTYLPAVTEGGSFEFWNAWFAKLKKEGVDFVKIDVQTNIEACLHGNAPVGRAAKGAYEGMDAAAAMLFNGSVINCTAMAPECLWNKPLGLMNRNSGDFVQGDLKSMKGFAMEGVYNSLYNAEFSHVDGDMLQTHDVTAKINIVLHALSGGCVYLSDHIGKSVPELARAFADSKGRLYRCDKIGLPTKDRIYRNAKTEDILLKFFNMSGKAGYIGLVNVNNEEKEITDWFSPSDVYGISGESFVMYNYFDKKAQLVGRNEKLDITLGECKCDMRAFVPVENNFAFVGNVDKYVPTACVEKEIELEGRRLLFLREGGRFAYYCEKPHKLLVNGRETKTHKDGILSCFEVKSDKELMVEFVF